MKPLIEFHHGTARRVATVTEYRWWWPAQSYTVALYGTCLWVRDSSNALVTDTRVLAALDDARRPP